MSNPGVETHRPSDWEVRPILVEPKRLLQSIPAHRPDEGRIGDCYRTAVACLVGWGGKVEDVPHFVEERQTLGGDSTWDDLRRARHWCRLLDRDLSTVTHEQAIDLGLPYIASVPSKAGPWPHCVIGQHGEVIHDPSGGDHGYTLDVLTDDVVEILTLPYDPDPNLMVRIWEQLRQEAS